MSFANCVVTEAFFLTTSAVRSRIHFFPSAGITAGHYPVACELTVFGKGVETRAVRLDGGRLNQPDGIRLEDAFPSLANETSGVAGLQVRLEASHGRINLLSSRVVIEMVSPQFTIAYGAASFRVSEGPESSQGEEQVVRPSGTHSDSIVGFALQDQLCTSSLVAVNASNDLVRPTIRHVLRDIEAPLQMGTVAASSVVEFPLEEPLCKHGITHETLWGDSQIEKFWIAPSPEVEDVSWYVLQRDPLTRRPISVCAL